MKKIFCITVSTKYSDILKFIIPQNARFFEKWCIVTDINDVKTIEVVKNFTPTYPNLVLLFFNYYEHSDKGVVFDKGGAIRCCQLWINQHFPTCEEILIMDSDIYLPDDFDDIFSGITIEPNTIYGAEKRLDYYSEYNFRNHIIDFDYPWSNEIHGFFQLYKNTNPEFLYDHSFDARVCDWNFKRFFENKITIPNLVVSHLGKAGIHFLGREDESDFIPLNT